MRQQLASRGAGDEAKVDDLLRADEERRKRIAEVEQLKATRNRLAKEIGALMSQKKSAEADARKAEAKTVNERIAELDALRRLGWRGAVCFVDDNFIGNKRALKEELLPTLIEWQKGRRGTPLFTEASINLADDEGLMRMMVEAGFNQGFVGMRPPRKRASPLPEGEG